MSTTSEITVLGTIQTDVATQYRVTTYDYTMDGDDHAFEVVTIERRIANGVHPGSWKSVPGANRVILVALLRLQAGLHFEDWKLVRGGS